MSWTERLVVFLLSFFGLASPQRLAQGAEAMTEARHQGIWPTESRVVQTWTLAEYTEAQRAARLLKADANQAPKARRKTTSPPPRTRGTKGRNGKARL